MNDRKKHTYSRSFRCALIILCATSLAILQSSSGTFYTTPQNSSSNNFENGSKGSPFRTIQKAVNQMRAGDTLLLSSGVYRETVIINVSGTATMPIVIRPEEGATPVLRGSEIIQQWNYDSNDVWKTQLEQIDKRSASSPRDQAFWCTSDIRRIFLTSKSEHVILSCRQVATKKALSEGTFYCEPIRRLLLIKLPHGGKPSEYIIEVATRGAWLYIYGNNVRVSGINMEHSSTLGLINWAACQLWGDSIIVDNCSFSWSDFIALGIRGNHNIVQHCIFSYNGNSGVGGEGRYHIIERCRMIKNNLDRYSPDWHAGGMKVIPGFSHGIIRNNEFADNLGPGLWLDGFCDSNMINANYCHDNEGPGIMVEISSGNIISNNISFRNINLRSGEFLQLNQDSVQRKKFIYFDRFMRRNELSASSQYSTGSGRGIYISSSPGTKVLHNTCSMNESDGICVEGDGRTTSRGIFSSHFCEIRNNICAGNRGVQIVIRLENRGETTNSSDHNLVYSLGAPLFQNGWNGNYFMKLEEWHRMSGNDEHSSSGDPQFLNTALGDFRLQWCSPALRIGVYCQEAPKDFDNLSRKLYSSTTAGAYEEDLKVHPGYLPIYQFTFHGHE